MRLGQSNRGVALITVLLITAVITIIVATMATQQSVDIRRTSNVIDRNQAYLFAEGAEGLAKYVLSQDTNNVDHRFEPWAIELPPYEVEGGTISGYVRDMQGCFNLNNLVENGQGNAVEIARFKQLLLVLELDATLADAVVDWIDVDNQITFPGGAESEYYARLDAPYQIANRTLLSASELLNVKGVSAEVMATLRPYVCALPSQTPTKINVNFAPEPVLMTLAPGMTQSIAEAIIEARDTPSLTKLEPHFETLNDMFAVPQLDALLDTNTALQPSIENAFGVSSQYFMVVANGRFGEADMLLYSLLERSGNTITTYYRAQGSY
ncbi:MAG: type II secretion system minor pseudopilin GspK [Gammaproteobacteria bacterium]|nr:type II secretion system minor pseudopilin GspK [Gammaproteobacteria bacterium]